MFWLTKLQLRTHRAALSNLEFSPEIRGGRGSKLRECLKICSKTFLLVFWLNSGVKQGIWGQNGKMECVTIQGQTVKIPLQSPGKLSIVPALSLFFHLSLPKIWQAHPHKNYIFQINKDRSITSQSLEF